MMCSFNSPRLAWLARPIRPIQSDPTIPRSNSRVTVARSLQTTVGVLAEEVRRCPREHAPRLYTQEMADVRERINPLDGQLAVTAPVGRHLLRLVGVEQHAGVLGEVEVYVDGRRFADSARR